jgi:uncharacterized protein YjiS (DUF1127 family)
MPCGSRTSTYSSLAYDLETAKRAPWYRHALTIFYAVIDRKRSHQLCFELEKARQRGLLKDLDDHLLSDIGLTREQADREARKPFWR